MTAAEARSGYHACRTSRHHQTAALSLDLVPCFPSSSATSVRSIFHHSKIVLGVLIEVLRFDSITIRHRLTGKRQVPFILLMRVAVGHSVLVGSAGSAVRRRAAQESTVFFAVYLSSRSSGD